MMYFKSPEHKQRFITSIHKGEHVYSGRIDSEYGSALYILTSDSLTWKTVSDYVDDHGIRLEDLLEESDFSHGYELLVKLAGNLFNGNLHVDPLQLIDTLDENNFNVALTAIMIRRNPPRLNDLQEEQQS